MTAPESLAKLENLNSKIVDLKVWLQDKNDMYLVDTKYIDSFGIQNASKNWDSVLRRMS